MNNELSTPSKKDVNWPERTTWCGIEYVRGDLYALKEFEAKQNAETVIRQAVVIRKLQKGGV